MLLTTGPMSGILRDGIRQVMAKSAAFDPNATSAGSGRRAGKLQLESATQFRCGKKLDQEFIGVMRTAWAVICSFNVLTTENADAADPQLAEAEGAARGGREQCDA